MTITILCPDVAHRDLELGEQVKGMSDYLKTQAEKQGRKYEPGLFRFTIVVMVDLTEDNITGVIYQDKQGNKVTVPVNVQPTTSQANGI